MRQSIEWEMDWQAFIFDPHGQWIGKLERVARRRFLDANLADQAFEKALAQLQADGWARLHQYAGNASPGTFLLCVFRHLIEDFAIARFGKCRAPLWLRQLGLLWNTLYKRLCCERQLPASLSARMASADHPAHEIEKICRIIKNKIPDCGMHIQFESLDNTNADGHPGERVAVSNDSPERLFNQTQTDQLISALSQLFDTDVLPPVVTDMSISASNFALLRASQPSDPSTRLLIKMVFQDDLSLPKAARILGIAEHTARRELKKALFSMQQALLNVGIVSSVDAGVEL